MKNTPNLPGPTVVSEKQYRFVPPKNSRFWPWIGRRILNGYLARTHGVQSWELHGKEHLEASIKAGHGILLVPNHPRPSDPMALGLVSGAVGRNLNVMASAHLFLQSRLMSWLLPRIGAFSVYREGIDRESLRTAVNILATASRPLAIFAEGVVTRTNDRLIALQDGVAFIARTAAKQRAEAVPGGKVVIHPLALRYTFHGDVEKSLAPVLDQIEARLTWQPQSQLSVHHRVVKLGHALLALRELEYFGGPQSGSSIPERTARLLDRVLVPLEQEWLKGRSEGTVVQRVKNLRKVILPDLIDGEVAEVERLRRWRQLFDLEVAQQLYHFPPDYLGPDPTPMRLIETVERYEEALGNPTPALHPPLNLRFDVGEAIEVNPVRDRRAPSDAMMDQLRASLVSLLGITESQPAAA
jgi:1-acyl-sn-glycerol-3-phosphate acyltransferase